MKHSSLTICSVDFHSADALAVNTEVTKKLNNNEYVWNVATTDPPSLQNSLQEKATGLSLIPFEPTHKQSWCAGSYQHAQGLQSALNASNSRYVVLLDPDFIILQPQWCTNVIQYMARKNISFLGAPYSLERFVHYRYFPSVVCMFIDCDRIPKQDINLLPELGDHPANDLQRKKKSRRFIGKQRDVGWHVYERFGRKTNINSECLQQSHPTKPRSRSIKKIIDSLVPDRYAYYPKRKNYSTTNTFADCGLDLPAYPGSLTEEFFWKGEPFGIHLRSRLQKRPESMAWSDAFNRMFS